MVVWQFLKGEDPILFSKVFFNSVEKVSTVRRCVVSVSLGVCVYSLNLSYWKACIFVIFWVGLSVVYGLPTTGICGV